MKMWEFQQLIIFLQLPKEMLLKDAIVAMNKELKRRKRKEELKKLGGEDAEIRI